MNAFSREKNLQFLGEIRSARLLKIVSTDEILSEIIEHDEALKERPNEAQSSKEASAVANHHHESKQ